MRARHLENGRLYGIHNEINSPLYVLLGVLLRGQDLFAAPWGNRVSLNGTMLIVNIRDPGLPRRQSRVGMAWKKRTRPSTPTPFCGEASRVEPQEMGFSACEMLIAMVERLFMLGWGNY